MNRMMDRERERERDKEKEIQHRQLCAKIYLRTCALQRSSGKSSQPSTSISTHDDQRVLVS